MTAFSKFQFLYAELVLGCHSFDMYKKAIVFKNKKNSLKTKKIIIDNRKKVLNKSLGSGLWSVSMPSEKLGTPCLTIL